MAIIQSGLIMQSVWHETETEIWELYLMYCGGNVVFNYILIVAWYYMYYSVERMKKSNFLIQKFYFWPLRQHSLDRIIKKQKTKMNVLNEIERI